MIVNRFVRNFKDELAQPLAKEGPFSEATIHDVGQQVGHRWRACFWTPSMILVTFLRQVLFGNCSCRQAVAFTLAEAAAEHVGVGGRPTGASDVEGALVSSDPSGYSHARQRLPLKLLTRLSRLLSDRSREHVGEGLLWCGRRVRLVDGSTVSMPDTPELQKAFPQPAGQKRGCGFPMVRLTAIFCWASGTLLDWACDSLRVHEVRLFRRLIDHLLPQDVVVGDRAFGSYYDLALLLQRGVDGVFRLHGSRPTDLRRGHRLGRYDRQVTWRRPYARPPGVTPKQWEAIPEALTLRQVRVSVNVPGFRSQRIELITTLLDAEVFSREELGRLYRDRWMAELNLRHLKTTLGMEVLHCKSPDMIRKELAMYAIAYNLVRLLMWQAATAGGRDPRRLSFAGAQQRTLAMLPYLRLCKTAHQQQTLMAYLLSTLAADVVPYRPDRIEPRCVKRRPKSYLPLSRPRNEYRAWLKKRVG